MTFWGVAMTAMILLLLNLGKAGMIQDNLTMITINNHLGMIISRFPNRHGFLKPEMIYTKKWWLFHINGTFTGGYV
jgi:hypothetical protein